MSAAAVVRALRELADPKKAAFLQRYFKTGPGEYGEGDVFLGVTVPNSRRVARQFREISLSQVERLLRSDLHEPRLVALLILVDQYACGGVREKNAIFKLYFANVKFINNWDLIDTSARDIVGAHVYGKNDALLSRLAKSKKWNERRIAVIATQFFIRRNDFACTLKLARMLLRDDHDLLHKAVGWMLREIGDRDAAALRSFLSSHAHEMPRTMLRYAIEKLSDAERKRWMNAKRTLFRTEGAA